MLSSQRKTMGLKYFYDKDLILISFILGWSQARSVQEIVKLGKGEGHFLLYFERKVQKALKINKFELRS